MRTILDLFRFLFQRKKFWLVPTVAALLLLGIALVLGGNSTLAPFIYSIF
jgi:hypothetical protein